MRAIKNLMKAKRPMWRCGECKCITLNAWRCADEFCNCGEETTPAPVTYTVTFQSNDIAMGSVSVEEITVNSGTEISVADNVLVIGENTITAVAESGDRFVRWTTNGWNLPETVTWNMTIVANFEVYVSIETISAPSVNSLSMVEWTSDTSITFTYTPTDATNVIGDIQIFSSDTDVARVMIESFSNGTATIHIDWDSYWTATITYYYELFSYTIDVTVTMSP